MEVGDPHGRCCTNGTWNQWERVWGLVIICSPTWFLFCSFLGCENQGTVPVFRPHISIMWLHQVTSPFLMANFFLSRFQAQTNLCNSPDKKKLGLKSLVRLQCGKTSSEICLFEFVSDQKRVRLKNMIPKTRLLSGMSNYKELSSHVMFKLHHIWYSPATPPPPLWWWWSEGWCVWRCCYTR